MGPTSWLVAWLSSDISSSFSSARPLTPAESRSPSVSVDTVIGESPSELGGYGRRLPRRPHSPSPGDVGTRCEQHDAQGARGRAGSVRT